MMNMNFNQNQINNMMPNPFLNNNMNQFMMNPNMMNMNPNMINMNQNMMNMNLNMINMNRNLNQINNIDQINEVEDILPYINEPKIMLKFSSISLIKQGKYIKVKLPKSITKNDLYSIAKKYQYDYCSDIILSYNNYIIQKDDTTIEGFEEGSIINIIEDIDVPDGSYYKYLMKKFEHIERIFFKFRYTNEKIRYTHIEFPKNITVSEMIKGTFSKLLLNSKISRFDELSPSDNTKISKFQIGRQFNINVYGNSLWHWKFGKIIQVRAIVDNVRSDIILIGTLNSIKELIREISFSNTFKKIKKLSLGINEFLVDEIADFSLRSIGINDNVDCKVEFYN